LTTNIIVSFLTYLHCNIYKNTKKVFIKTNSHISI